MYHVSITTYLAGKFPSHSVEDWLLLRHTPYFPVRCCTWLISHGTLILWTRQPTNEPVARSELCSQCEFPMCSGNRRYNHTLNDLNEPSTSWWFDVISATNSILFKFDYNCKCFRAKDQNTHYFTILFRTLHKSQNQNILYIYMIKQKHNN